MRSQTQRYRLSVGFERTLGVRVLVIVLMGALGVGGTGCLGFIVGMLAMWGLEATTSPNNSLGGIGGLLPFLTAVALASLMALYCGLMIAKVVRYGAWLDGTSLTVQSLRTRTVDLAFARSVALQPTAYRLAVPPLTGVVAELDLKVPLLVIATDGTTVRLALASQERVPLPPDQLRAIADVVSAARCPGAAEVTGWLRHATQRAPNEWGSTSAGRPR